MAGIAEEPRLAVGFKIILRYPSALRAGPLNPVRPPFIEKHRLVADPIRREARLARRPLETSQFYGEKGPDRGRVVPVSLGRGLSDGKFPQEAPTCLSGTFQESDIKDSRPDGTRSNNCDGLGSWIRPHPDLSGFKVALKHGLVPRAPVNAIATVEPVCGS